jgi:hypothetical protein
MKAKFIKEIWMIKKKGLRYMSDRRNCSYMYQIREKVAEAVSYKDDFLNKKNETETVGGGGVKKS